MPPIDASNGTEAGAPAPQLAESVEDTLELRIPDELLALFREGEPDADPEQADGCAGDLLDHLAEWGPATTSHGSFQLVPVRVERDLVLISRWMNDPAVAAFWELAGPDSVTAAHLCTQLDGDGRSFPAWVCSKAYP